MPHKHFSASRTASCVTCVTCVTSGILPMPEQVAAIRDYTVPKDKGGVQRFLGMLNYCHCFLPKIAGKLAPLHSARRLHGPLSASRRSKQPSQHSPPQRFCTTLVRWQQQASWLTGLPSIIRESSCPRPANQSPHQRSSEACNSSCATPFRRLQCATGAVQRKCHPTSPARDGSMFARTVTGGL